MLLSAWQHRQLHHPRFVPAFPALPRCGKQTLTPVLSSLTENIHFADTHTLGITGNQRLYIEVGTTLPSRLGAEGLPRTCAHSTFRGGRRNAGILTPAPREPSQMAPLQGSVPEPKGEQDPCTEASSHGKGAFCLRFPPSGSIPAHRLFQHCPFPGPLEAISSKAFF